MQRRNLGRGLVLACLLGGLLVTAGCDPSDPTPDNPCDAYARYDSTHPDSNLATVENGSYHFAGSDYAAWEADAATRPDLLPDRLDDPYTLDYFRPEGDPPAGGWPVIVQVVGAWRGEEEPLPTPARYVQDYGFAVVNVSYRGLDGEPDPESVCGVDDVEWPAAPTDVAEAVSWIRSHAAMLDVDPDAVILHSGSAGAHISAAVATGAFDVPNRPSSVPDGLVLFNGPYEPSVVADLPVGSLGTVSHELIADLLDCDPGFGDIAGYAACSPTAATSADVGTTLGDLGAFPPTLLYAGEQDDVVAYAESARFGLRLCAAGREVHGIDDPLGDHTGKEGSTFRINDPSRRAGDPERPVYERQLDTFLSRWNPAMTVDGGPEATNPANSCNVPS